MKLKNNVELYDFLVRLSIELGDRDLTVSSRVVARICKKTAARSSNEFLSEARAALRKIVETETRLTAGERSEIAEVLEQLDRLF